MTDHSYHSQGLHSGQCAGVAPHLPGPRLLRLLERKILHQKRLRKQTNKQDITIKQLNFHVMLLIAG